jgi:hypothetical protein
LFGITLPAAVLHGGVEAAAPGPEAAGVAALAGGSEAKKAVDSRQTLIAAFLASEISPFSVSRIARFLRNEADSPLAPRFSCIPNG